jgi:DNA polymerase-3 subunit gamma/tau
MAQVTTALSARDGNTMLGLVDELERNGGSPQHFSRELARYLRNVLVAKISGSDSRLIAASPSERAELARIASTFTEEDLTRYLQLSLDLFRDLQYSLQPRFHLELGLLKMVQAGKLQEIEEAIANLGPRGAEPAPSASAPAVPRPAPPSLSGAPPRTGPSPFEMDRMKKAAAPVQNAPPVQAASAAEPKPVPQDADWRALVHGAMVEKGLQFSADAIAQSDVALVNNELVITAQKQFQLDLGRDEIATALKHLGQAGLRFKIVFGEVKSAPAQAQQAPRAAAEDEVTERALSHPEVQRFRELFGGEVRTVRNLKEN